MDEKKLLVVGELNIDLILNSIHGFPEIGKEILADNMTITLGSSSAIMAANSATLRVPTSFCGLVGDDSYGDFVLDELRRKNVQTHYIRKSKKHQTGVTIIMNYHQDRANVTFSGAMASLTTAHIPWPDLKKYSHLHISSLFLQKGIKNDILQIFKKAKKFGVTTSLDLQWDPSEKWDFDFKKCLPFVDIFLPNRNEVLSLTKSTNLQEGIDKIKPFANCLVIKLGEEGSIGIQSGELIKSPAYNNTKFVDAIGAGDSFNSGFLKKYIEGESLTECLKWGNLMGALNTTAAGGTEAFKSYDSIRKQVQEIFNLKI